MSILSRREDGIAWILLDRPRGNILDTAMISAIRDEVRMLADDRSVKLLAFGSTGPEFSFGASIEEHLPDRVGGMMTAFHEMFREIEALGVPTAAAVAGRCLGGGLELAAWCGRVFAAPDASFSVPEVRLGVFPPMGTLALQWRMGAASLEMLITGGAVNAVRGFELGLVDELDDEPEAALRGWYRTHLDPLSASSLRYAWRAARLVPSERMERDLPRLERLYLDELMRTHDANEGIAAFIGRRPPRFAHA